MIKKLIKATHSPAHPARHLCNNAIHAYIGLLAAIISHNKSASVTYPHPQESRTEISHCLRDALMMDASVYLRLQVIYLHGSTNDRRTSNHSSTPSDAHCISLRL